MTSPHLASAAASTRTEIDVRDYQYLKEFGFSPFKATEIQLDASRGNAYAKQYIDLARNAHDNRGNSDD